MARRYFRKTIFIVKKRDKKTLAYNYKRRRNRIYNPQ